MLLRQSEGLEPMTDDEIVEAAIAADPKAAVWMIWQEIKELRKRMDDD